MTRKGHRRAMTREEAEQIIDRVLTWPAEEKKKIAEVICAIDMIRFDDDLTDEELKIIEEREGEDLATDEEVEAVFSRYR
jgi:hypothetical protein